MGEMMRASYFVRYRLLVTVPF